MDIEILLWLQEFRNTIGAFLAEFLSKMTYFGEMNVTLIIMALIYWCLSKTFGSYLLMGWSGSRIVNGFLKVTACAYRPWIRDARIVPYGSSMTTATGYSFPSGHSMNAASLFGGGVVRKDLPRFLRIVLGVILFLVAFSRIYLGVHTPQDITIGVTGGLLVMWLADRLMKRLQTEPDKDLFVMWTGIVIASLVALDAAFKSYPADYDAAGQLIVDGAKMAADTYKGVGWCVGFLAGWVLERRYIGFSTDVSMMARVTRLVSGLLGYYIVSLIFVPVLKNLIPGTAGIIISCFFQMFYVSFLFPWCIKQMDRIQNEQPISEDAGKTE